MTSPTAQPAPEASFKTIIFTMGTQAMIALGEIENPFTKESSVDLRQAKWHVDSLRILREKTQGNLSDDEERAITNLLADVQVKYFELSDD